MLKNLSSKEKKIVHFKQKKKVIFTLVKNHFTFIKGYISKEKKNFK